MGLEKRNYRVEKVSIICLLVLVVGLEYAPAKNIKDCQNTLLKFINNRSIETSTPLNNSQRIDLSNSTDSEAPFNFTESNFEIGDRVIVYIGSTPHNSVAQIFRENKVISSYQVTVGRFENGQSLTPDGSFRIAENKTDEILSVKNSGGTAKFQGWLGIEGQASDGSVQNGNNIGFHGPVISASYDTSSGSLGCIHIDGFKNSPGFKGDRSPFEDFYSRLREGAVVEIIKVR